MCIEIFRNLIHFTFLHTFFLIGIALIVCIWYFSYIYIYIYTPRVCLKLFRMIIGIAKILLILSYLVGLNIQLPVVLCHFF